ncbi:MAG: SMUG2 DNA glycosylase family protein, partial [Planctomycetes bacterium]|nr:SMUG2 DNA glycosylase family protein [Planctomycetota bacterium]
MAARRGAGVAGGRETFAERVIAFNRGLRFPGSLPAGIRVMNPFVENAWALAASAAFYRKYYSDRRPRVMLVGINPGRFGGGLTGVPFTDPKRLRERCGVEEYGGELAHEPSSVFVYEVIRQYGGEVAFYRDFYINSVCPLGFTAPGRGGGEVNCNYYDRPDLVVA